MRKIAALVLLMIFLCTAAGCGNAEAVVIESADCPEHILLHQKTELASCMKSGTREYWYCETCGRMYSDPKGKTQVTEEELYMCELGHGGMF